MFNKGQVILVPFPFTDLSSSKVRPAVIVSHNLPGDDVVVAFISSKSPSKQHLTDVFVPKAKLPNSGLKTESIIKLSKMATLSKSLILGELGQINSTTRVEVDRKLRLVFGIK